MRFPIISVILLFNIYAYSQSADYSIQIEDKIITATPRTGSGLARLSGLDFYTVFQSAINALTPKGRLGTGGGSIEIGSGYFYESSEPTITGWEGNSGTTQSQLKITGQGNSTRIIQNTNGKNGLVIKNMASVCIRDISIQAGSKSKSAILLDDSGTETNQSVNASTFDNLYLTNSSATYPTFYMKNFQKVNSGYISATNNDPAGIAMQWEGTASDNNTIYGNSQFSYIEARGGATSGTGLYFHAAAGKYPINICSINYLATGSAYYGLKASKAASINIGFHDSEANQVCVSLGTGNLTFDNSVTHIKIMGAYYLPKKGGTAIQNARYSNGNSFDNIKINSSATETILTDARDYGPANEYSLLIRENTKSNYTLADKINTKLNIRTEIGNYSIINEHD